MAAEHKKAFELIVGEVRAAIENMPVLDGSDDLQSAEVLQIALLHAVHPEVQRALGIEVVKLMNARISLAIGRLRMKQQSRDV